MEQDNVERKIAKHLRDIMNLLGIKGTESNEGTPERIAKMWNREVFANRENKNREEFEKSIKVFSNTEGYEGKLLVVRDIPFNSMCEHHFMPFFGTVSVGYAPDDKIIGLSKIPRIVKYFSKKPQLQERFTNDILRSLVEFTKPLCAFVEVKAKHSCVSCRGVELPSETISKGYWCGDIYSNEFSDFEEDFHRHLESR